MDEGSCQHRRSLHSPLVGCVLRIDASPFLRRAHPPKTMRQGAARANTHWQHDPTMYHALRFVLDSGYWAGSPPKKQMPKLGQNTYAEGDNTFLQATSLPGCWTLVYSAVLFIEIASKITAI